MLQYQILLNSLKETIGKLKATKRKLRQSKTTFTPAQLTVFPCIRLPRLKFELANQSSAGGKNFTVLNSMEVNEKSIEVGQLFLTGNVIKYSGKGI